MESLPVKVSVLAPITNNNISSDQMVCYNTVPDELTGPFPDGGDPSQVFWRWEESNDGGV